MYLQIKKAVLGSALFAAWSMQKARGPFSGFGEWMHRAPYISCAILILLSFFMAWQGLLGLAQPHTH
jgi:nickel/cobalt exporter